MVFEEKEKIVVDAKTEIEAKSNYLRQRVDEQTALFNTKKKSHQRNAFTFKILTSVLTVAVTILLGVKVEDHITQSTANIALILSGMATLLNIWDTFFNNKALWTRYTVTTNQLHGLKAEGVVKQKIRLSKSPLRKDCTGP